MGQNTKLLAVFSFLVIGFGVYLLWFGFKPDSETWQISPSSSPNVESSPEATSSAALGIEGERVLVTEVIDGDTFRIESGQTVRMIGIDTPETKDPRRPVGCFGKEASEETKKLINSKEVILQKDVSETDKYGRFLRYVYLPLENEQLLFVNDYLVRKGFAKVLTYPPDVKYNERFRQAEIEARETEKGLWGKCK